MVKERVIAYIDGFNLYFGMTDKGSKDTLWLDIQSLSKSLLKPHQELVYVKYFTSRVRNNPNKQARQKTYIEAIETLSDCRIYYGHYQSNTEECYKCHHKYQSSNEKMTDVNIAVEMITDAYTDKYDTAMLISGDSDLIPPIKAIHNYFPTKRVFVAFPPNRFTISVSKEAKGSLMIGHAKLKGSQFPNSITKPDGHVLVKPTTWV